MTALSESELRTMLRYEDMVVDGMFVVANACRECLKPFAPYGVGVTDADAHRFCWNTHDLLCELEDLRAAAIEMLRAGDHDGPCVNMPDQDPANYSEYDSCARHLQAAARRRQALLDALNGPTVQALT